MSANEGNPDPNASQALATSIMLALLARARSGKGQAIEVTMLQANAWANADEAYDYSGRPPYSCPTRNAMASTRFIAYTRPAQGWVFLACVIQTANGRRSARRGQSQLI